METEKSLKGKKWANNMILFLHTIPSTLNDSSLLIDYNAPINVPLFAFPFPNITKNFNFLLCRVSSHFLLRYKQNKLSSSTEFSLKNTVNNSSLCKSFHLPLLLYFDSNLYHAMPFPKGGNILL